MSRYTIHPDTHLGPLHLTVSHLERAEEFYTRILGVKVFRRFGSTLWLTVNGASPLLAMTLSERAIARPPQALGLYHFAILVPSRLHLAYSLHHLLEMHYPIQGVSDNLVHEAIYLADPDGNGIALYADRPREEWPWQQRQLQVAANPLDLDFVLAELGQGKISWHGLDPDIRIGHLHLHVTDLRQSEDFYRRALGFELTARSGSSLVYLAAGTYHHHLGLNTLAISQNGADKAVEVVGLRYFTICLPDENELVRLTNHLQHLRVPFQSSSGQVRLQDPGRNIVIILSGEAAVESLLNPV
ncbi:MAG: VOC family protein [bacterium]